MREDSGSVQEQSETSGGAVGASSASSQAIDLVWYRSRRFGIGLRAYPEGTVRAVILESRSGRRRVCYRSKAAYGVQQTFSFMQEGPGES